MKLTLFFLLAAFMHVSASVYSQQTKISISLQNVLVKDVLKLVEDQSDFFFLYKNENIDVNRTVSVDVKKKSVEYLLDQLFKGTTVSYEVVDKQIVLVDKRESNPSTQGQSQQQKRISGKVSDSSGSPLPGVTVLVKGTTNGIITDSNGAFTLSNIPENAILVFSFVGMKSQEIKAGNQTVMRVTLEEETVGIEEVVAVGYGTQKKINLTGSLASINTEKIKSISTTNVVTGLAGKLPGLRVTQRNGEPGSYGTAFDIRGFGTPLIIVDGIERSDFNRFDPNEIENITVLKDASAAVYGVKAANGVILVTTKKGNIGKPIITYSGNYEMQKVTNTPEVGNAYQFSVLTTENEINQGKALGATTYTPDDIQKFKDGTYPSTDWYSVVAKNSTKLMHHNISVTGGSEKIKYFTSMGSMDEMGLWKTGDLNYKKYNMRSSVTGYITDNLTAQLNIDGRYEDKNEPGESAWNVFKFTWMNKPTLPVYANNNPEYLQDMTYPWNPLAMTTADIGGYTKTKTKTFQGNFTLEYKFKNIDGLTAKLMYGFYSQDYFQKSWRKKYTVYTYDKLTDTYKATGVQNNPSNLAGNYAPSQRSTVLGQLTYEKSFVKTHNVKASLAFEGKHEKNDNLWGKKEFSIDIDQFFAGNSLNAQVNSGNIYENANQNVIGRFNYDYSSKYLFEFAFNYGGSSKFPKGKRWGFFPYSSAGWRISEEPFIKNNIRAISNLKLRASWGQMGDDGASSFQFLTGYNYPGNTSAVFNNTFVSALGFRGMPNPNITWYTVTTKNIGLDLSLWQGLLSMQMEIFQRDRSGLLATRSLTIPGTVGAGLPQENLNKDMRRGFELVIGHSYKVEEFKYNVSANLTYTRGQRTYIERSADGNSYLNWRGNPTNRWDNMVWGYKFLGQFQTVEEILSSPIQDGQGNRTLRPGDFKYQDVNHDGMLSDLDVTPIGRGAIPDINFGMDINVSWKKFDLNVLLQGAANYNFQYIEQMASPLPWGRNSLTQFMDRWHHTDIFDKNSPWIPGRYPATGYVGSDGWTSVFWRPDASYVRLKNLELGYTIENSLLKRANIRNLRIYVSGFNLFTLTKMKYMDPEQDPSNYNYQYPLTKNYNIGVNVTF